MSSKKPAKNRSRLPNVHNEQAGPEKGVADGGESINPMGISDQEGPLTGAKDRYYEAPSPGVPISANKFEKLKQAAKSRRRLESEVAQQDPAQKNN